jgi:hypothetical protein
MISDINNVSEVKPEDYNYKQPSQMIDDDPIDSTYKKNSENPFELANGIPKSNSLSVSDSKSSNASRKSDLSSYGRLSIRMKERISKYGDEDILIDFSSRHTAYLFSVWIVFVVVG